MANASAERCDGKLECFLSRHLPTDDYQRLLTKQPCVAVVEGNEKPAHRFAIVGHCRLYLTDVPPKSVRMTLQLRDVESIQILNEPPEFLQGKERDEAVHVQIHFAREQAKEEKSLFGSLSNLSPGHMRRLESKKGERTSLPSPLLTRNSDIQNESSSVFKSSSTHSLEHFSIHQKSRSCSPIKLTADVKTRTSQHSPPSVHITSASPVNRDKVPHKCSKPRSVATGDTFASPHGKRKRSSLEKSLKTSPEATSITSPKIFNKPMANSNSLRNVQLSTASPSTGDESDSLCSSQSSPSLLKEPALQVSRGPLHSSLSRRLVSSDRDLSVVGLGARTEKGVLDLYILKPNTDFFQHLCTAWQDQKIVAALGPLPSLQVGKPLGRVPSDHFSHHFHTLRQQLVSAVAVQDSAQLTQELCTACKKYFIIKHLFWEDRGLLAYLIEKLQYLPSRGGLSDEELTIEIEYRVIVLDLLYQMLRETHGIEARCLSLTSSSGRCLRILTNAILNLLPTVRKQESALLFEDDIIENSCGILSEIFRLTQQMRWPCSHVGVVSPEWLLDILAKHPHIREFCRAIIAHESSLLRLDHLQPHDLVSVYHMSHVLHSLVHHSRALLDLIHTHFAEEFKYFISISQARQKLPVNGPLTSQTLTFLQHTKSKVLS